MSEVPATQGAVMTPTQAWLIKLRYWIIKLRRKLPYLVWYDDEVDVTVTIKGQRLGMASDTIWLLQDEFRELGITFDAGSGFHGRDWEWDWSLKGPISVIFRGRTRDSSKRTARPKPKLVVSNNI